MNERAEVIIETYENLLDVLESAKFFIYNDPRYEERYLAGYQASYDTIISYLYDTLDDLHGKIDNQ